MSNQPNPPLEKTEDVRRYERIVLWHGAIWFFFVLCAYYILRPIREQIGATYGIENLSWMFGATFTVMLVAIPTYSYLVGRINRRKLVPLIYVFFIFNLFLFWGGMTYGTDLAQRISQWLGGPQPDSGRTMSTVFSVLDNIDLWIARLLFMWISVYGLFIVSFFWSVIGDMLSTGQGRKVFGYMASGGTIGQLVGSQIAWLFVKRIGVANLLLFPIVLLAVGLIIYGMLEIRAGKFSQFSDKDSSGKATGGNPFAGFTAVFKSRYLFAICLYGLFMATCGTTVYFQQSEIVNAAYAAPETEETENEADSPSVESKTGNENESENIEESESNAQKEGETPDEDQDEDETPDEDEESTPEEARTGYFAQINFSVSIVTLIFQLLVVGFLMKRAGLGLTLAMLPLAYIFGITALALSPTIEVLAVVSVLGRAVEYGISNPAKEVLFTSVNREDRYKAKSFIDTIVRRGGDWVIGAGYKYLRGPSVGYAMTTLSWIAIPVAVAWAGLSIFLGYDNKRVVKANKLEED